MRANRERTQNVDPQKSSILIMNFMRYLEFWIHLILIKWPQFINCLKNTNSVYYMYRSQIESKGVRACLHNLCSTIYPNTQLSLYDVTVTSDGDEDKHFHVSFLQIALMDFDGEH